jgi:hypothetical protein
VREVSLRTDCVRQVSFSFSVYVITEPNDFCSENSDVYLGKYFSITIT